MPRRFFAPTTDDLQLACFRREHAAVRHILTAPLIARRTAPYLGDDDFDWAGLGRESETMSGGETLLVEIAYELWHAEKVVGLWELANRLDAANFRRVLAAIWIYRGATPSAEEIERLRDRSSGELAA